MLPVPVSSMGRSPAARLLAATTACCNGTNDDGMRCNGVLRRRLRIVTWHSNERFLRALARTGHELLLVTSPGDPLVRQTGTRRQAPDNVTIVPSGEAHRIDADVVLCQSHREWAGARQRDLGDRQLSLPHVYVEHHPPGGHPTDTRHPAAGVRDTVIVFSSSFDELMWDSGDTLTRVIEPAAAVPVSLRWSGIRDAGITAARGRPAVWSTSGPGPQVVHSRARGIDLHERIRRDVPLDLVDVDAGGSGLGTFDRPGFLLPPLAASWRFLFQPARHASLDPVVCEAMMIGMPVVAVGTAEHVIAVRDSGGGFADTSVSRLVDGMQALLLDRELARQLGERARAYALERFTMERFCAEWDVLLHDIAGARALTPMR